MICHLLGSGFNYLIQLLLGGIAIAVIYLKYRRESPRRPLRVWLKDTGKQIVGMVWAHGLNLILAIILTSHGEVEDQCVPYFVNYLVDSVLGIALNVGLLALSRKLGQKYRIKVLDSGNYGDVPHDLVDISDQSTSQAIRRWLAQVMVWVIIVTLAKMLLFGVIIYPLRHQLLDLGGEILGGITSNSDWELVIVMIIVPLVVCILQFVIQDQCFKRRPPTLDEELDNYPDSRYINYPDIGFLTHNSQPQLQVSLNSMDHHHHGEIDI